MFLGSFFKRFYLFIFRERGREGEREGEKHQCVVASHAPPTGDLATEPHQQGLVKKKYIYIYIIFFFNWKPSTSPS